MKVYNICRWVSAIIMLQTLFFKFTSAPESVHIFSTIGIEPWGRIATGIAELVAATLLLYRPFAWSGALLGIGLMVGAVGAHLVFIGIEVAHDNGKLFAMALTTLLGCLVVLYKERNNALDKFT